MCKKLLIIFSFLFFSCFNANKTYNKYREGLYGTNLHVYVSDTFSMEDEKKGMKIEDYILKRTEIRATALLASYISLNLDRSKISVDTDRVLNLSIINSVKSSKISFMECSESLHCTAEIVYDASPVLNTLKTINTALPEKQKTKE